jgi:hypothetical protein
MVRQILTIGALVFVVSACSASHAQSLAVSACQKVNSAIAIYDNAKNISDVRLRQSQDQKSLALLRQALPIASVAAGQDPSYQALQADLSETSRVSESNLIPSLKQQCSLIDSGQAP